MCLPDEPPTGASPATTGVAGGASGAPLTALTASEASRATLAAYTRPKAALAKGPPAAAGLACAVVWYCCYTKPARCVVRTRVSGEVHMREVLPNAAREHIASYQYELHEAKAISSRNPLLSLSRQLTHRFACLKFEFQHSEQHAIPQDQ